MLDERIKDYEKIERYNSVSSKSHVWAVRNESLFNRESTAIQQSRSYFSEGSTNNGSEMGNSGFGSNIGFSSSNNTHQQQPIASERQSMSNTVNMPMQISPQPTQWSNGLNSLNTSHSVNTSGLANQMQNSSFPEAPTQITNIPSTFVPCLNRSDQSIQETMMSQAINPLLASSQCKSMGDISSGSMLQSWTIPSVGSNGQILKQPITYRLSVLYPPNPQAPQPSTRERPPGCRTVFIGGLPENAKEEHVTDIFGKCGEIQTVRMSKKNFCHIRFVEEFCVDNAIYLSGWRMRIDNCTDNANTGRLHVDFAQVFVFMFCCHHFLFNS